MTYSSIDCSDIKYISSTSLKDPNDLDRRIINNGNNIGFVEYNINGGLMNIRFCNTCPFDSIFEILTTAYAKSHFLKIAIDQHKEANKIGIFNAVIDYFMNNFSLEIAYHHRANIEYPMYKYAEKSYNNVIDCRDNFVNVFERFMHPLPSITRVLQCTLCNYRKTTFYYSKSISSKDMYETGLYKLGNILEKDLTNKIQHLECEVCKKTLLVYFSKLVRI